MKPELRAEKITYTDFQHHLCTYASHVHSQLQDLDDLRFTEIPNVLSQRRSDGTAFLEKTEVISLVEWKLKHGTYRPNLAKLVASNDVASIRDTTSNAFATYDEGDHDHDYAKAITMMTDLRGIGPATASLFLSCYDPVKVPFFSDELYRYLHWEEDARTKGWDRKIGYTMKEYRALFEKLQGLRGRLEKESGKDVKAVDVEKMAYALAKGAQKAVHSSVRASQGKRNHEDDINKDEALQPRSSKRRRTRAETKTS